MAEIAVLIATYNGERYLCELLESILNQTFPDIQIYIHDDASKDNTISIIQEYQSRYPEKIRQLIYPATGSSCANFMSMLSYVKEPYVMFCDQDDVWLPEKTEILYREMKKSETENAGKPCLVFSDLFVVDSKLQIISNSFMHYTSRNPYQTEYKRILMKNVAPGCTMLLNRNLIQEAIKCTDVTKIGMHDAWVMLIAGLLGKISFIDMPLIYYRQHQENVVGAQKVTFARKIMKNLYLIFSSEQAAEKKKWLDDVSLMASELTKSLCLKQDDKQFLTELAEIRKQNKLTRVHFYYRNQLIDKKHWWLAFWV